MMLLTLRPLIPHDVHVLSFLVLSNASILEAIENPYPKSMNPLPRFEN